MTTRIWWLTVAAITLGVTAALFAQPRVVTLAIGRVNATDQEAQECYFRFSAGAMLVLHPQGEFCPIARELVGKTGTLMFVLDAE